MGRIIDRNEKNLIGANVRKLRMKKKFSQQQLSDKLETVGVYICRGSVSRVEDQSRTVTDIELFGLAEILEVSMMDLFEGVNLIKE